MKRSQFNNFCSLLVACAFLVLPVTLGCGGGEAETGGDVATEGMGEDIESDVDMGVAEPADTEPADTEPADTEPADGESADGESADGESADGDSADGDSEEN